MEQMFRSCSYLGDNTTIDISDPRCGGTWDYTSVTNAVESFRHCYRLGRNSNLFGSSGNGNINLFGQFQATDFPREGNWRYNIIPISKVTPRKMYNIGL